MPSTTHVVIVDDRGNVASMTSSIENAFGSRLMVGWLSAQQPADRLLLRAGEARTPAVANRVEPGKRPRSSMSPTIILKDGKPVYALGSPGGSRLSPIVANDHDRPDRLEARHPGRRCRCRTDQPVRHLRSGGRHAAAVEMAERPRGARLQDRHAEQNSGLHGVAIGPEGLKAAPIRAAKASAAGD
jgi:gamma-glutamyltranspeptidase/glutathione hydrolase